MTDSKDKPWEITIQTTNRKCPFLNYYNYKDNMCKHPNVVEDKTTCCQNNCPLKSYKEPPKKFYGDLW